MSNYSNIPKSRLSAAIAIAFYTSVTSIPAIAQEADDDAKDVEVIRVTGSYVTRNEQSTMSSPIQIVGNEEIMRSGFSGVDDLIINNTANTGSVGGVNNLAGGGNEARHTRSANLRGLGPSSTLVLLNGHRVSSQEQDSKRNTYTNLAALVPTIAVDRIETVLDGASAIYGSDAIAGAMNIITDDNYEGFTASWQHTAIENAPANLIQFKMGGGNDRFHGVFSSSYEYKANLQNGDRAITASNNTSGTSQPGNYALTSRPIGPNGSDVIIDNGVNGPINYSELYDQIAAETGSERVVLADPHCTVEGTGGIYVGSNPFPRGTCQFSYQQMNPIMPETKTWLNHASASYILNDEHELFFEGRFYKQEGDRYGVASMPLSLGSPVVPASNPYNPFGVDVQFTGRVLGVNADYRLEESDVDGTHLVLGAKGDMGFSDWEYNFSGVWSQEESVSRAPDTDLGMLQNALNGYGGADCQIDPFGNPDAGEVPGEGNCVYFSPFGADQLDHDERVYYNLLQPAYSSDEVIYQIFEFVVNGSWFELPGGTVGVAIGGQTRKETRKVGVDAATQAGRWGFFGKQTPGEGSRTIDGVFTELYLPWTLDLDMQVALRYEDYGRFDTLDPKIGINWRINDDLSLRMSASTAFRAPSLAHSVGNQTSSGVSQTVDPLDPNDNGTFRVVNTISNPDLEPEESTNINIGLTWMMTEDLTMSLDHWRFDFENQVTAESASQVIQSDPNGPKLIRDADGRLLAVNVGYFNAGKTKTNGIDYRIDYRTEIFDGHYLSFSNSLTWINEYTVQVGEGQPVYDVVGRRNDNNPGSVAPEFRDTMQLSWMYSSHSANITMRYVDSVEDDVLLPMDYEESWGTISSSTVFDAQYAYQFGKNDRYQVAVGAVNLFDTDPPAAYFTKYLSTAADPLGRQAYLRLSVEM
ncbi:TonB-dependent receptor [Alteromonas pelagimontana]|uniref:TonB-dependent receptor n=1 Tax=Alteromonas pelagimontana TaxID=1858656 RepID=A0A6M4MDG7_9ALTE|nr:TonB-dependent receptor [Alteromonas pelagimontana]QJR81067.1 TonB-dependent receptor [Alteromonas pelagimontana]